MQADDWIYSGEGGAHVIFAFQRRFVHEESADNNTGRPLPQGLNDGCLLRVSKQDIVHCLNYSGKESASEEKEEECALRLVPDKVETASELWYLAKVVAPLLQPYVDIPRLVILNSRFARGLYHRAMNSGKIPPHRQSSWQAGVVETAAGTTSCAKTIRGLLLHDYRIPPSLNDSSTKTRPILSVEIKPKAGYTAISPLVNPDRRCKYQQCRFRLLHGATKSRYNPLDFFSHDLDRMRQSIQAVIDDPRNNFRMWLGRHHGDLVMGDPPHLMPQWLSSGEASTATLVELLGHVLYEENTFLERIKALQKLDIIDSDGAVRIYDRLVHEFLGGSHEKACALLDVNVDFDDDDEGSNDLFVATLERLSLSPSVLLAGLKTSPSDALQEYMGMLDDVEELLLGDPLEISMMDGLHRNALSLVSSMSEDDCVALLRLWLLSLAMCDVSFFISFEALHQEETDFFASVQEQQIRFKKRQTAEAAGILVYYTHGRQLEIAYRVKAIDCDRKPAKKLKSRRQKEDAIFADLMNETKFHHL